MVDSHFVPPVLGSVVIPAHNEESVIARTLATLEPLSAVGALEVIVVCNGCVDKTAEVARRTQGVSVLEVSRASKVAALRAAERHATYLPRIYLDADVELPTKSAVALLEFLAVPGNKSARPPVRYDLDGAGALVRAYYNARQKIPSVMCALWGAGVYGLSSEGRARFDEFPDVRGDDLWVDNLFEREEVVILGCEAVVVRVPRTSRDLLKILGRWYCGNHELGEQEPRTSTLADLRRLSSSGVRGFGQAAVYGGFAVTGRLLSQRASGSSWAVDSSSRRSRGRPKPNDTRKEAAVNQATAFARSYLRPKIASGLLALGVAAGTPSDVEAVRELIRRLAPMDSGRELVRVGDEGDGGYLVPDDFTGVSACFSPGVDNRATFERDLVARGLRCHLADASVAASPYLHDAVDFLPKFVDVVEGRQTITLDRWVEDLEPGKDDLILQMDIEGCESAVLLHAGTKTLERFRIMVVEFHDLEKLFDRFGLRVLAAVFARLLEEFAVVHIHPNNYGGVVTRAGVSVPRVLEITFLRRDRMRSTGPVTSLPHARDQRNAPHLPDLLLPPAWLAAQSGPESI